LKAWSSVVAAAIVAGALHLVSVPRTLWEYDEHLFAMAVERYEPLQHHPPPPGAPIYIGFAKLVALVTPDAFHALVVTSLIFLAIGFAAWVLAFRELTGDTRTAATGALLLYASPALLVSGTLPQSDTGALALFGLAAWAAARRNMVATALLCAAAVGWRPQIAVAPVALFAVAVVVARNWRERLLGIAVFGGACVAWLIVPVVATGGPLGYCHWLTNQAADFAAHDARLSRSGSSAAGLAGRFIAHPWGRKWLAWPLLAAAAAGILSVRREERRRWAPLAAGSIAYLAFALSSMDPADAVRYAVPSLPLVALLAAVALNRVPFLPLAALLYAAGAYAYTSPALLPRAHSPSPPTAAADWIEAHVPKNAIILFDPSLGPHASDQLRDYTRMGIDAGLAAYSDDPARPLVLYTDGGLGESKGVSFRWPDADACRKLTRRHYGVVSVIPLPPAERFRVIEGVFAPERTRDGLSWRWIGGHGVIELPDLGAREVRLVFRTPPLYPFPGNRVRVDVQGAAGPVFAVLPRTGNGEVRVPLPPGRARITLAPERTFVPALVAGSRNRDERTLSVMLTRVEQLVPPR
jgi:hypothetical protein